MATALVLIFVLGYSLVVLEQPLGLHKSAVALLAAGLMWTVYALGGVSPALLNEQLGQSLQATAQLVFFLLGAMTLVEVVSAHNGFDVLTRRIQARSLSGLLVAVAVLTFFLSSVLDNLTTPLVMMALVRKLLVREPDRWWFGGIIVIAANAGGAWTPVGDVTTTMLWVGGQVTALKLMQTLWLPCCINLALPLAVVAFQMRGQAVQAPPAAGPGDAVSGLEQRFILLVALGLLLLVPVFHGLTGLPPFMGMLLALGLLWLLADAMHRGKAPLLQQRLTLEQALHRIDLASVAFFTGILLAVAVLEHTHILAQWAQGLTQALGRQDAVVMVMGLVSAVVDNVPLLAAAMGMYPLAQNPSDTFLWHFLAYCTGTGGSMLIIGSAAGVAVMGLERIPFGWYARRVGSLAVLGYLAGAGVLLWLPR